MLQYQNQSCIDVLKVKISLGIPIKNPNFYFKKLMRNHDDVVLYHLC